MRGARWGKPLKARRLSFTWQMHNSQGSPGDQICPIGNSTPLSSREQPGQRTARKKGRVGRSAVEGPECPPDLQQHPPGTEAPAHSRCVDSSQGVYSTQGLPAQLLVKFPLQTCTWYTQAHSHKPKLPYTPTNTQSHSHRHTHKLTHSDSLYRLSGYSSASHLVGILACAGRSPGTQGWDPYLSWAWAPGR